MRLPSLHVHSLQDGYHPTQKLHQRMIADMFTSIYMSQRDGWYTWDSKSGKDDRDGKPAERHFFVLPPKDAAEAARRENEAAEAAAVERRARRRARLSGQGGAGPAGTRAPSAATAAGPGGGASGDEDLMSDASSAGAPRSADQEAASRSKIARDAAVGAKVAAVVPRLVDSDKQAARAGAKSGGSASRSGAGANGVRGGSPGGANGTHAAADGSGDEEEGGEGAAALDDGDAGFGSGLLGGSLAASVDALRAQLGRLSMTHTSSAVAGALSFSTYLVLASLALPLVLAVGWASSRRRAAAPGGYAALEARDPTRSR